MDYLFWIKLASFIVVLVVFSVRIERRLTRIEVDLDWIKRLIMNINCNGNSKEKER